MRETRILSSDPVSGPPSPRPAAMAHAGNCVALEPVNLDRHTSGLFAAGSQGDRIEATWDYLPYGPFADEAAFGAWLGTCTASADPLYFAIRDLGTDRLAGMMGYLNIEPGDRSIEIGHIWFAPFLRKTRAATEAIFLSMRHAFDDLHYRRLEWKCDARNAGSRGAAQRFGFVHEGIFYRHRIVKGRNRDTAWYSLIDEEWPAVRSGFEAWLDPANFDGKGMQKQRLADLIAGYRNA